MPQTALTAPVRFGPFTLDPRQRALHKHGVRLKLHGQPFEILLLLLEHPGEVVVREQLQRRLWSDDTFVDFENGLNAAMKKLRQTLGDSADAPRYIETVPRIGYRFLGAVESEGPARKSAGEAPSGVAAAGRVLHGRRLWDWRWLSAAMIVALGLMALGGYEWRGHRTVSVPIQSIAVLPFQNLSGDPAQDYIADGMTDELITNLAKIGSLHVISRTSTMHFKNTRETLPQIAAQLHADAIVEGTVARSGQEVRVTAQLIEARDDRHLWAESYDRNLGDILTLQGQVAQTIAERVEVHLTPEERKGLAGSRPINPEAYQAYVKGTDARDQMSEESLLRSIQYFNEAVQLDPQYAQGYAGMSHSYYLLGIFGFLPPVDAYGKAKEYANKALSLDASSTEAYNSLGDVHRGYDRDWVASEADYKRAIALSPSYPNPHSEYALLLSMLGRHDEAIAEAKLNRQLDPITGQAETFVGYIFYLARRYDEAIAACRKGLSSDPYDPIGHYFLALAYDQTQQTREAVAEAQEAVKLSARDPFYLSRLGYAYARAGEGEPARKVIAELTGLSRRRYVAPMDFAFVYLGLGDKKSTFEWLETAYAQHNTAEFLVYPTFDHIRSDQRFRDLMQRMKLPL